MTPPKNVTQPKKMAPHKNMTLPKNRLHLKNYSTKKLAVGERSEQANLPPYFIINRRIAISLGLANCGFQQLSKEIRRQLLSIYPILP